MATLRQTLTAAGILTGNSAKDKGNHDLDGLLQQRLDNFIEAIGPGVIDYPPARDLRCKTGLAALHVIEHINGFLLCAAPKPDDKPLLGTRDFVVIRTSISLIFKWASDPVLSQLNSVWPSKRGQTIDLSTLHHTQENVILLASISRRLLGLLVSQDAVRGNFTPISPILVDKHLLDILKSALAIGWLPKSLIPEAVDPGADFADIRSLTMRLLQLVQPRAAMSALGIILSKPPALHTARAASFLATKQLLRSDGIRAVCASLFGELSTDFELDETSYIVKMERLARGLGTNPIQMKPEDYFSVIIPNCITVLKPIVSPKDRAAPPMHTRAIAFTLSRFLTDNNSSSIPKTLILRILHGPWHESTEPSSSAVLASKGYSVNVTLEILSTLITNTFPSRELVSTLLSPIIAQLYSLFAYLKGQRANDPTVLELCRSLFVTWAKITDIEEAREILWSIIQGQGGMWTVTDGELQWLSNNFPPLPSPASYIDQPSNPEDLTHNPFNLRPAPKLFAHLLKETDRSELVSEIFAKTLEAYLTSRRLDDDPLRSLLLVQLVLQMQDEFMGKQQSVNIFKDPKQILALIHNALESESSKTSEASSTGKVMGLAQFRIVPEEVEEEGAGSGDEWDSDDEMEGGIQDRSIPNDLAITSVTLLLALLEGLPDISLQNNPILDTIWGQLQPLTRNDDVELAKLAREARLVLSARLATGSVLSADDPINMDAQKIAEKEKYQKALKLLQDPILPVRAHGLILLKEIVSPPPTTTVGAPARSAVDTALIPGIMNIFMESIQDDDSYIFLNAVQGLSALAGHSGRETLRGVLAIYIKGLGRRPVEVLSKKEIDIRLRVGEALNQVIRELNQVLPAYSDLFIPPLFALVGEMDAPTVIRVSALSILAQCVDISPQTVAAYRSSMLHAMLDLLEIESIHAQRQQASTKADIKISEDQPTTTDPKVAEFRRAALHLLGSLMRDFIRQKHAAQEEGQRYLSQARAVSVPRSVPHRVADPDEQPLERIDSVLGYISSTDVDSVVRFMAQELLELLHS